MEHKIVSELILNFQIDSDSLEAVVHRIVVVSVVHLLLLVVSGLSALVSLKNRNSLLNLNKRYGREKLCYERMGPLIT